MKTYIYILTLCTFAFFTSCQKNTPCTQGTTTYNIYSSDKSEIPYFGKDTLTFVRTTAGDTFTFYGTGWQQGYNVYYTPEDCPQKENSEARILMFQSSSFPYQIILNQSSDQSNYESFLSVSFQNTNYQYGYISFLRTAKDTVTILQNTYYNVDSFSDNNLSAPPANFRCYYNKQYGILRMRLPSGETWELIPKK